MLWPLISIMMHLSSGVCVMVQFDEQKDQVIVERVLRVIFLDADRPSAVSFLTSLFIHPHIYIL